MQNEKATPASRRNILKLGASLAASTAAAPVLPGTAQAQGTDAELARVQGARRILIKSGVVLTLDRQVGDFPEADVLVEDGRIRDIRPNIAAGDAAIIDAANRIVSSTRTTTATRGYCGTSSPTVSSIPTINEISAAPSPRPICRPTSMPAPW
jgi:hypothetical protein